MEIVNYNLDLFQKEREKLQDFASGTSIYAIYIWDLQFKSDERIDIHGRIASIIDIMTFNFDERIRNKNYFELAIRCSKLINFLTEIDDAEFYAITKNLARIGKGLSQIKATINADIFSEISDVMIKKEKEEEDRELLKLEFPSEHLLRELRQKAEIRLEGQAKINFYKLLDAAKTGDKKSLWAFYEFIKITGLN